MTERRKFRCFCHQGRALPSVQPVRLSTAAARRDAMRRSRSGAGGMCQDTLRHRGSLDECNRGP